MASETDISEISTIDETGEYIANNLSGLTMTEETSYFDSNAKSFLITHPDIAGRVRLSGRIVVREPLDNLSIFYTPTDTSIYSVGISFHDTKEEVLDYIQGLISGADVDDDSDSDDSDSDDSD